LPFIPVIGLHVSIKFHKYGYILIDLMCKKKLPRNSFLVDLFRWAHLRVRGTQADNEVMCRLTCLKLGVFCACCYSGECSNLELACAATC